MLENPFDLGTKLAWDNKCRTITQTLLNLLEFLETVGGTLNCHRERVGVGVTLDISPYSKSVYSLVLLC